MLFDGELRNAAIGIKEIAFRDDYYAHTLHTGMGRSWSQVTIDMAMCDTANLSSIFANNAKSLPTRVFSGALAWPTLTGHPTMLPGP